MITCYLYSNVVVYSVHQHCNTATIGLLYVVTTRTHTSTPFYMPKHWGLTNRIYIVIFRISFKIIDCLNYFNNIHASRHNIRVGFSTSKKSHQTFQNQSAVLNVISDAPSSIWCGCSIGLALRSFWTGWLSNVIKYKSSLSMFWRKITIFCASTRIRKYRPDQWGFSRYEIWY